MFEIWNDDLQAQRDLAQSQIRANQAREQAASAKREAARLTRLHKQGLTSEESADQAESLARSQLGVAEAALARTRLQAPFAGTVAEVNGEVGEFVTPSPIGIPTPPAVDSIDTTCLYVSAPIDEVDTPAIRPGMPARILLDAFSKTFFSGEVRRVAPYVLDTEKQARTVDVEVNFTDVDKYQDLVLLPGYSADIEVILARHPDTLRIPTETLLEGLRVYVYDATSGTISARAVKTGLSNWQHTEILDGLQAGQQIVLSIDREGLADGVRVKPGDRAHHKPEQLSGGQRRRVAIARATINAPAVLLAMTIGVASVLMLTSLGAFNMPVASGRFLPADDPIAPRAFAVLGHKVRQELFGQQNPLGQRIRIGGDRYRVIGSMASRDRYSALIWTTRRIFPRPALWICSIAIR